MRLKQSVFLSILGAAAFVLAGLFAPSSGVFAQDDKVKTAMELLKSMADKLGPLKIEGMDTVAGKQVPGIYFGSTKMDNNFSLVDPKGKVIASIQKNEAFYGEVDILGKPYITGYEPIRDQSKGVIGIYYVGYLK